MKKALLFLFFVCVGNTILAQLTDTQLDSLKAIWRAELKQTADYEGLGQPSSEGNTAFSDSVFAAFQLDTFYIEGIYSRQLDADPTTFGSSRASLQCELAYDSLMTKYYQLFLSKLNKGDQKQLVAAQKSWLKFREAERKVNEALIKKTYSGGGTIQQLIYSSQHLYITKQRVSELVSYLTRLQ